MSERFDRASRATESAVDTTIAMQLGLATAMASSAPGHRLVSKIDRLQNLYKAGFRPILLEQTRFH
jgi:hypothetical protein